MSFDIVINVGPNDMKIIEKQIHYTLRNIVGHRNVYIIAPTANVAHLSTIMPSSCTVHDEAIFPFRLNDMSTYAGVPQSSRNGWYLQQLLKLYAGLVIPGILERWLVIDADTFFLRPTIFVQDGKCMYANGTEYHRPYFTHMSKLLPGITRMRPISGICHHMIFEKHYIQDLFARVEALHQTSFWQAFLRCIEPKEYEFAGASEYELYFNYMLLYNSNAITLRQLSWRNVNRLDLELPYDYISYHWYSR
jgi:hypothetical protein